MNDSLNIDELKALCEAIIRDIGNKSDLPIAKDWGWARLLNESMPAMYKFLKKQYKAT
jgi:hypothetical protein